MTRRLVAEIGSCGGDMAYAEKIINRCAEAGVWVVKGQLYQPDTLVTRTAASYGHTHLDEPATQWEAFTDRFTYPQWDVVAEMCRNIGVGFAGSVFDVDALRYTDGWEFIKIASADITYETLIRGAAAKAKSDGTYLVMSTGGATLPEIAQAVGWVGDCPLILLACTLEYPTQAEDANVNRMSTLSQFGCKVGYSDHTVSIYAADYAFRHGAVLVEKHVTVTPGAGGDHNFAATPEQLVNLIEGRNIHTSQRFDALLGGTSQLGTLPGEAAAVAGARRSWHATKPIRVGEAFTPNNVAFIRPTGGIVSNIYGLLSPNDLDVDDPVTDVSAAVFNLTVD